MREGEKKNVGLIGFPMDLGGNERGVDMGPSAIRLSGLVRRLEEIGVIAVDMGNVMVHTRALVESLDKTAHFISEILRACESAADMTVDALDASCVPLLLGGDHSVAIGSLWGMASRFGPGGVIWIDAHADINTPKTTLSGNVHGMPLAVALGLCADDERFVSERWPLQCVLPEHTVVIALRDLDQGEKEFLRTPGAPRVYTIDEIDRRGIAEVAEEAVSIASGAGFMHVSLDLDAMDPHVAPGVGTPVPGGLSYREAHLLLETIAKSDFHSVDVVEVNPILDVRNTTAKVATDLICSLFGARIL